MRAFFLIGLMSWVSISRAECERPLATTTEMNYAELRQRGTEGLAKSLRGLAAGISALTLATVASPAQAGPFLTQTDVENTLKTDYGMSTEDAARVMGAIKKFDPENKLPISGMMNTSGLTFSFFLNEGTWSNITTSFKDERTGRVLSSNCLYDMYYSNGGIVASIGYKWVIMILLGDQNISELSGAKYGRGFGLTFDALLGTDLQYLPPNNRSSGMLVISPQIGIGAGIRFPKIKFKPAASCSRW